jgi:hypothetical protein
MIDVAEDHGEANASTNLSVQTLHIGLGRQTRGDPLDNSVTVQDFFDVNR